MPLPTQPSVPRAAPHIKPGANAAFQSVIDSVPGAWFFTRRDGSFAYVNLGACASLGYTREELQARTIFNVDPTVTRERWELLWSGTKPSDSVTIRTVHRRRDGADYPVEVRASRIWLDGEDVAASFSIDLTASEQTRAALQATEAKFERLLQHLPDLVFRLRLARAPVFEFLSPSASALLGYLPDELLGPEGVRRIVHPEDAPAFAMLGTGAAALGRPLRFVTRSGETRWFELRASALADAGEGDLVIEGAARDVTDTYAVELTNRRLRAAIEQTSEAVVVIDALGRVEYVNPAYVRSTGREELQVRGQPWSELELGHDREFGGRLDEVLASGVAWSGLVQSRRLKGERYDETVTVSPLRDDAGSVVGAVAVKRDITSQRRLEEQLRHAEKMNAVGRLAGGIAHDFNNLLHVIQGNAEMGRFLLAGGHSVDTALSEIVQATQRASALVSQLLTFSRSGAVDHRVLRLDELIDELLRMLRRLLGEHIRVEWTCSAEAPRVRGNREQLEQLVANLCINARDAMPGGGLLRVHLRCATPGELPAPLNAAQASFVCVELSDDGEGMTPEVQARLFEPFFTTKAAGQGTGLGLATAYAVTQSHGGAITVTSTPGSGSQFRVYLPSADAPLEACVDSEQPSVAHLGARQLVMVAEDEPAVRRLTALYLRTAGYEVCLAPDGEAAQQQLEAPEAERFALLVVDAVMPKRSGSAIYEWMRERGSRIPVIFVTGYDSQSISIRPGDDHVRVLSKPFSRDRLIETAATLLSSSESCSLDAAGKYT